MSLPSRRTFLQTAVAAIGSLVLPRRLRAGSSWLLHTPTGDSWAVGDPVAWALANARQPILERAREGLLTLDVADRQRVIRLITRRCKLNLIEVHPGQVVVHHWTQQGKGDLRPFLKQHGLARKGVRVVLLDRKREVATAQTGDDFLYGERLAEKFPLNSYEEKWRRRAIEEPDDDKAAPCTVSSYCWAGVEHGCIPWRVLKSAWRHETAPLCRNCDKPTLLVAFGYFVCGFYKRGPMLVRICPICRSRIEDRSPWDGPTWMQENLEEALLPSFDFMFAVEWRRPDWRRDGVA